MNFDVSEVLDGAKDSLVVQGTVDLSFAQVRGHRLFGAPVAVAAQAARRQGVVTLDCTYTFHRSLICDRCLTPFEDDLTQRSSHIVVRELNGPDDGEFVVAPDGIVRLDELATNDIIPELPSKALCREDCKGICPCCGADRNQTDCDCTRQETDPRLEALNKLLES